MQLSNDTLLVKFNNDERYYVLEDFMYKHYEKSLFTLSQKFNKTGCITLENMTYEQFKYIFDFLNGNYKHIRQIKHELDYLGIINNKINFINQYEKNMLIKQNNKFDKLLEFVNGTPENKLFLVNSFDDYTEYKQILEMENDIIPIQFMITIDEDKKASLKQLCIYDCIPIFVRFRLIEYVFARKIYFSGFSSKNNQDVKISKIRLIMNQLLKKANECENSSAEDQESDEYESDESDEYEESCDEEELKIDIDQKDTSTLNNTKLIHAINEYEYFEELITLVFDSESKYHQPDDDLEYRLNDIENNTHKLKTCINLEKLNKSIQLIKNNHILDIILNMDYNKNIAYQDYISEAYYCDDPFHFLIHTNVYLGFINLK